MTRPAVLALAVVLAVSACATRPAESATTTAPVGGSDAPTAPATAGTPAPPATPAPTGLGQLVIDDQPAVGEPYRRDQYPTWLDPDHNGCDAREDALIAASLDKPHVARGCSVTAGRWLSAYDGVEITDPSKVDVDHVVPLGEVHRSGGATWETARRAQIANDPANLWPVSASANRSKGDSDPAQWRPPRHDIWCLYATRWITVKVTYGLTADHAERDALGAMLDTCPKEG